MPWPAPVGSAFLIVAAGLPALPNEELAYHVHAHLDVFVGGAAQVVPAGIGIDVLERLISPLHTHDTTGIVHIESRTKTSFRLGQFFTEWGVLMTPDCIGAYCKPKDPIHVYVNGSEATGDPSVIEFDAFEEIAVIIGPPPAKIPATFDFPPGY